MRRRVFPVPALPRIRVFVPTAGVYRKGGTRDGPKPLGRAKSGLILAGSFLDSAGKSFVFDIDHHLHISGIGSHVPDNVVTNETLEDLVSNFDEDSGAFPEWVDRVTHIRERRHLHQDGSAGDMAREACRKAIEDSGVDPAEIGMFIMATFTTKNIYPGEETQLVQELGMGNAATFYLTAGCAGSIYAMQIANAFLRTGIYRHVLVCGTEHLSIVTDMRDPLTAILFGDGAGAALLSRRDEPGSGGIVQKCVLGSNYVTGNIHMDNTNAPPLSKQIMANGVSEPTPAAFREYIHMDGGPRVLRTAVNSMSDSTVQSLGFTMKDLKQGNEELLGLLENIRVVPHQANGRIVDGLRDKLGVRDEQVFKTLYRYGNISWSACWTTRARSSR
jgi:3-oxoacyl-[acyl-carrier-protein] synthase-3